MKEIILTCPFSGVEFTALETADHDIIARHALTGEEFKMTMNRSIKKYNLQREWFKHIETVTQVEAAEILDVSRQRVSKIAADGVIKSYTICGMRVFKLDDVLEYKQSRKVSAPSKEQ